MDGSELGDRIKRYETPEGERRLRPLLPVIARLDGRAFSRFTADLERPFDARLSEVMRATAAYLVEACGALVGYTQSDEISLLFHSTTPKHQIFFDARIQKMVSVLAALASVEFNAQVQRLLPAHAAHRPVFDCRVFAVPNETEAANAVLWRERDCSKDSVSMAARAYFDHEQTQGKSAKQLEHLLLSRDVNWNDYPAAFKRGSFFGRVVEGRPFTGVERDVLPAQHDAHKNPGLVVERRRVRQIDMPPFGRVLNREDVLFRGATPHVAHDDKQAA